MIVVFQTEELREAFLSLGPIIPTRTPTPILCYVCVEVKDGEATLRADNREQCGIRRLAVTASKNGDFLLAFGQFAAAIKTCTDEHTTITVKEQGILVESGKAEFKFGVADPAEFPRNNIPESTRRITVPAPAIISMLQRTMFACDTENSRYALGGVKLELSDGSLHAIATDGRRMSHVSIPSPSDQKLDVLVPIQAISAVRSILSGEGDIELVWNDHLICFLEGNRAIFTRQLEGRFPRWKDVMPTNRSDGQEVVFVSTELRQALRTVAVTITAESRGVSFTFADGVVRFATRAEQNASDFEMVCGYKGDPVKLTLALPFVTEFLNCVSLDKPVVMHFRDGDSAVLFTTSEQHEYVVMPLRNDD